jgi:hypothetical protein
MTPKEKAYQLVFVEFDFNGYCLNKSQKEQSIEFALKCVNEIINEYNIRLSINKKNGLSYWEEVKQEIKKL